MKQILISLIAVLAVLTSWAQDFNFTQLDMSQVYINPANTGAINGHLRAGGQFRDQWGGLGRVYRTYGASLDGQFKNKKRVGDALGIGITVYKDEAGLNKLATLRFDANVAYHLKTSKNSTFSAGATAGFYQQNIDLEGGTWDNQFVDSEFAFDPERPSGETDEFGANFGLDVGMGVRYKFITSAVDIVTSEDRGIILGASVRHLTRGASSIVGVVDHRQDRRYSGQIQGIYDFRDLNLGLRPAVYYNRQGKHQQILAGSYIRYRLTHQSQYTGLITATYFSVGVFHRWKDAFILALKGEHGPWTAAVSYDFTSSSLSQVNGMRGGIEASIQWVWR